MGETDYTCWHVCVYVSAHNLSKLNVNSSAKLCNTCSHAHAYTRSRHHPSFGRMPAALSGQTTNRIGLSLIALRAYFLNWPIIQHTQNKKHEKRIVNRMKGLNEKLRNQNNGCIAKTMENNMRVWWKESNSKWHITETWDQTRCEMVYI